MTTQIPAHLICAATALSCLAACSPSQTNTPARNEAAPGASQKAVADAATGGENFGAPLKAGSPTALAQILKDPKAFEGKEVTISAKVRKACTKKGCWMELATSEEAKGPGCRVTFKDYGFFVPLDAAGSTATAQGVLSLKTITPEMVTHYEQEGAHFAHKNADGSANEVSLVATGVELTRPAG